ncbi:MAG: ABC transporter ATP-binding protein [Planctomycetota bacterium]
MRETDLRRLVRRVLRYPSRLAATIVFSILIAGLGGASLLGIYPALQLLLGGHDGPVRFADAQEMSGLGVFLDWLLPEAFRSSPFVALIAICVLLVLLELVQGAFRFIQDYCAAHVGCSVVRDLTSDLHGNVVAQDLEFFQRQGVGPLLSRFSNDMAAINAGIRTFFGKALREPLRAAVVVALCLRVSWQLTIVFPFIFLPVTAIITYFGRLVRRATKEALQTSSRMMTMLEEVFRGVRIVKVFCMEGYERERFDDANRRLFRKRMSVERADAAVRPAVEILTVIGAAAVLVVGAYLVLTLRVMSAALLLTFYILMASLLDSLRKLSNVNNNLQGCLAGARRVFDFMDTAPAITDAPDPATAGPLKGELTFEGVSFAYGDGPLVLRDVTFRVRPGQCVALVGHSGAGKTTLANLIPRLYDPARGRILYDGLDLRSLKLSSLRSRIGMVTQETVLFNDTVAQNIAYGTAGASRDAIVAAARRANAHPFIEGLAAGYDTRLGEEGVDFSGGQRQRIAIARAVLRDPDILIFDEAMSALDSESERAVHEALEEFAKGRTTFVIAHRLSTIMRADMVVVLRSGRIETIGAHEELLRSSPTYRVLYATQFKTEES